MLLSQAHSALAGQHIQSLSDSAAGGGSIGNGVSSTVGHSGIGAADLLGVGGSLGLGGVDDVIGSEDLVLVQNGDSGLGSQRGYGAALHGNTPVGAGGKDRVGRADGLTGQMMEPIEWRPVPKRDLPPKDWATTGRKDRDHNNIINSLYMDPEECDRHNDHLAEKYALMEKNEVRWSETECEDAEIVITAYGTPARIALTALETLRAEGLKVGLFRPITLWPFPEEALRKLSKADHVKAFLDVEMSSTGQMIDDVRLSVEGRKPIHYLGHAGGVMPTVEEMVEAAKKALKEGK